MKKTILFLILMAVCTAVHAQGPAQDSTKAPSQHLGLEIASGYSMVMGKYKASDMQDETSGYATNGWQLKVTFDWMGRKDLGLAFQYAYQHNPMKDAANLVYPKGIGDSIGSGAWSNHYLLAGPVFMKMIRRLHVDARILGGVIVSSSPNFTTVDPYDTTGLKQDKNLGTGFAYQVSAGIGYAVSSHLVLKFDLNLMGGWPVKNKQYGARLIGYETVKDPITGIEYSQPVYSAAATYEIKKIVTTLNPSLGLVFRF